MIENKIKYFIPIQSWIILEREEIVDYRQKKRKKRFSLLNLILNTKCILLLILKREKLIKIKKVKPRMTQIT